MHKALALIDTFVKKHNIEHLYIAYSGGIDSTALLHLSSQFKKEIQVHAIHIHHGLSSNAGNWLKSCQTQAGSLDVYFIAHKLLPPKKLSNIENWARSERYAFFEQVMLKTPNSLLLTGHHIEDQAETFLLQALRGSGLKGLAAIAERKTFANGFLLRPFLHLDKNKLINYAHDHNLTWIEDESNQCTNFRRNAIRHNVMPKLRETNPQADITLARSAQLCAEADLLLNELLTPQLKKIATDNQLNLVKLKSYSILQQKHLLKIWLTKHKIYPSQVQFLQIYAGTQSMQSNWQYALSENYLSIGSACLVIETTKSPTILIVSEIDILNWLNERLQTAFMLEDLIIRPRQAGERCRPIYRHKRQSLKVIFQEQGIKFKDRAGARIITLTIDPNKIIAIYPFFICHAN